MMDPRSKKAFPEINESAIDQYQVMAEALLGKGNRAFLETILNSIPVGVMLQTLDGRYVFTNNYAADMHGYSPDEITKADFRRETIIAAHDIPLVYKAIQSIKKERSIKRLRFTALKKDGTEFRKETDAGLIIGPDKKPFGILIISRDVTEEEKLQKIGEEERTLAEALVSSAAAISSSLKLDDVLDTILELAQRVVPHDAANIMLIDNNRVHVVRSRGYKTKELHDFTMQISMRVEEFSSMVQMIEDGLPKAIPNTRKYPGWQSSPEFAWLLSYVGAPLRHQGQVIGIINLDCGTPDFFCQKDAAHLQAFADLAASAVVNARLHEDLQQQADEAAALFRASTALLSATGDIKSLAEQITSTVHQDFASAHVAVLLIDESTDELVHVSQSGYSLDRSNSFPLVSKTGLTVAAIREKKPIYVPDVENDPRYYRDSHLTRSEFDIPFKIGDEIIGVLNLESPIINGFNEKAQRVLLAYAERASKALENTRLIERLQQHDFQMDILNQLTQISLKTCDLKQMLIDQVNLIVKALSLDGCLIAFSDPYIRKIMNGYAAANKPEIFSDIDRIIQNPESSLKFAAHPTIIGNCRSADSYPEKNHPTNPFNAFFLQALNMDGIRIGSISFGFVDTHEFSHKETCFFTQIIDQISLSLSKNLSIHKADSKAREAENLRKAASMLTATLDLQEVLERILKAAVGAIPSARGGLLFQLDPKRKGFHVRAQYGFDDPAIFTIKTNNHEGITGLVADEKKARLFNDVTTEKSYNDRDQKYEIIRHKSWIIAPLLQKDRLFGLIELSAPEAQVFDENDLNTLVSFADTVTAAIRNAQLHAEVQQIALSDALTGLYNRRGFEELGQREINRSLRTSAPLSLLVIDIDFLKQVNDEYGHFAGDQLICETADCCRSVFRQIDLITRYGGDEFAILLPDTPLDHAREAAERFRRSLKSRAVEIKGKEIHITASIGVAAYYREIQTIKQLFELADKVLYQAKTSGRDAICVHENQTD